MQNGFMLQNQNLYFKAAWRQSSQTGFSPYPPAAMSLRMPGLCCMESGITYHDGTSWLPEDIEKIDKSKENLHNGENTHYGGCTYERIGQPDRAVPCYLQK